MSKSTYLLKLPTSVKTAAARLAKAEGVSLNQFIELLRSVLDPGCYWFRLKTVPEGVLEAMEGLRDFLAEYPDQRRKGRAL